MSLSKKDFTLLTWLLYHKTEKNTQRSISSGTDLSLGSVNQLIAKSCDSGWIALDKENGYRVTDQGMAALEPYKVRRAVIMAAGFGSRLMPITLNTP